MSKHPRKDAKTSQRRAHAASKSEEDTEHRYSRSRRRLLQSFAAGGAAVTVKALPDKWATPVLDVSVLPVHAQATCQVQSLDCSLEQINSSAPDTDEGNYNQGALSPNPGLPISGPNGVVQVVGWADRSNGDCGTTVSGMGYIPSGTFNFTATVDPPCEPVNLNADITGDSLWSVASGSGQAGAVDPTTGAVTFNNVVVNFMPSAAGTIMDNGEDREAVMDVRIQAPGVSDCVIDLTFTEEFNCVE